MDGDVVDVIPVIHTKQVAIRQARLEQNQLFFRLP